jgi:sporulation protein YlmC with PRC-barrel domain
MTNYTIRTMFAALLMSVPALAAACDPPVYFPAQPVAAAVPADPPAVATTATFRAKQVLGSKIFIQNNTAVGTVEDLVFDDAGNLEYLVVSTGDNKLISVPFEAAKWDLEKKTGIVNITPEVYKTIPTYTVTTYPQFYTPTYRTQVYKVYGLTPRELRRIERRIP